MKKITLTAKEFKTQRTQNNEQRNSDESCLEAVDVEAEGRNSVAEGWISPRERKWPVKSERIQNLIVARVYRSRSQRKYSVSLRSTEKEQRFDLKTQSGLSQAVRFN